MNLSVLLKSWKNVFSEKEKRINYINMNILKKV